MPILALLWTNKELIAKVLGVALVAFVAWFYFWHNPKVIKRLETEKAEAIEQVVRAHGAINLLTSIERRHDVITKISYRNISTIRYAPKPAATGMFLPGGVLQTLPISSPAP